MRFMSLIKFDESMSYGPPPPALFAAMGEFAQEGAINGTLVEQGGLGSSAAGAIVSLVNGSISTHDGPFTEAKELIGGYAVIEVRSKDEAIEWTSRFMALHRDLWPGWEGTADVLKVFGPEDFGPPA